MGIDSVKGGMNFGNIKAKAGEVAGSVKTKAGEYAGKARESLKEMPAKMKGLAEDTVDFAKQNPKKAGLMAGGVAAATVLLVGIAKAINSAISRD